MIVIRVQGGLGNQLFQYALALSLKKKKDTKVLLDITFYKESFIPNGATKRSFILDNFNIKDIAFTTDRNLVLKTSFMQKIKRLYERKFLPYYKNTYVVERNFGFDPLIFEVKSNCYLDGYWQSYKYFEDIEKDLRTNLMLITELSVESATLLNEIKEHQNSISLHVRRGDYVTKYNNLYYQIPSDYYINSINFIKTKLSKIPIKIYVFSDDIDWCKQNIKINDPHYFVSNNQKEDFEDLILMSNCSHNIIANSTYSWWAAWINLNSKKIVVCPKRWFNDSNNNFNNTIYPTLWNKL